MYQLVLAWSGSNVFMQVSGLFGVRLRGGQSRLVPLCSRWVVRSCVRRRRRHDPCLPDELSRRRQRPRLRGLGTPPKPSGKRGTLRSVRGKTSLIISPGAHSHGNTRVSHQVTGYVVLTPWFAARVPTHDRHVASRSSRCWSSRYIRTPACVVRTIGSRTSRSWTQRSPESPVALPTSVAVRHDATARPAAPHKPAADSAGSPGPAGSSV